MIERHVCREDHGAPIIRANRRYPAVNEVVERTASVSALPGPSDIDSAGWKHEEREGRRVGEVGACACLLCLGEGQRYGPRVVGGDCDNADVTQSAPLKLI